MTKIDSLISATVGDSLYSIVADAKKIVAEEIVLTADTTNVPVPNPVKLNEGQRAIAKFILASPKLYRGNTPVYGLMIPCFQLTFTKKKESCTLLFDFGLRKWKICDASGKEVKTFDLPTDDMLRLATLLFPENTLYHSQFNTDAQ